MRIWVIDTGSIIEILRRMNLPRPVRVRALAELDSRARAGQIIYPPEVLGELERAAEDVKKSGRGDPPLVWAKNHEANGTRYGHLLDGAKAVLNRVPTLIDPDKISVDGPYGIRERSHRGEVARDGSLRGRAVYDARLPTSLRKLVHDA